MSMENTNDLIGNRNRNLLTFKTIANNTWSSQVVTHLSTEHAQCCLTAVIEVEPGVYNVVWPLAVRIVITEFECTERRM